MAVMCDLSKSRNNISKELQDKLNKIVAKTEVVTNYCQFKELILNLQHCGLRKKSYVKCKNIPNFKRNDLISFIGYVEDI